MKLFDKKGYSDKCLQRKFAGKARNSESKNKQDSLQNLKKKTIAFPWINREYSPGMIGLHEEIEDFYDYMQLTDEERAMREYVITSVKKVVLRLWPKAEMNVFGSFCTGLYLPTSDIDIVVCGEWKYLPLYTLKEELLNCEIADEKSMTIIEKATVPLVKFCHRQTAVNVDISFNKSNGVQAVKLIKHLINEFPVLPKLVLVLKHFLRMRDLNEVYTGGLSSYSLFLLCVSFLQLHPRCDARKPQVNLAVLLIEFFELYGRSFSYTSTCIRVANGGSYVPKERFYDDFDLSTPSYLCIEDPVSIGNDVGKSSYNMGNVQLAFDYAYRLLTSSMYKENYRAKSAQHSYLGLIINIQKRDVRFRHTLIERWIKSSTPESDKPVLQSNKRKRDSNGASSSKQFIKIRKT